MADSLSHEEFDAAIGGKQPKLPTIDDVKRAAVARGINPDFAVSIMGQESGGNWKTKDSPKGARGGMQVMPGTFKQMMGDDGNPDDPWDNLEAGLRYIDYGRKKLGTDDPKLLAAGYHQGYDTPELKRGVIADTTDGSKRTRDYANEIAARMGINSADGAAAPRELSANPSIRMLQEWETDGHTVSWSGGGDGAPAPVPVDGPKDDGKGAVMRNLGYIGDNLKIGWNTLANAYDGLFAGQYAELYEANKAKFGDNPTDPAMAANQAELKANYDAHMGRVAQRSQESAQMQAEGRPETRQFLADAKDKPFLEQAAQLGDALVKNPVGVITDLGVQSAPASIAMMATAVAARFGFRSVPAAMAGGGAASATVEFGNDYAQQRAEGKSHEDAWTSASIKSGVVGLFDAASMGTAGKALDEVLKAGFGGKLKTIGKELGTQAGLGGAGEGLGSLAAGDTPSLSAVAAEAVGEMFSAPGEALTTFRGKKKDAAAPVDTGAVPAADVLGTLTPPNPEARPATPGAGSQAPTASGGGARDETIAQAGDALRAELAPASPDPALTTPAVGDTLARVDAIDARLASVTDPQEAAALTQERARLTANWPVMALGRDAPFATETGANLDAQYAIVDAGSLTASHDTNLRQNPAYPQSLQPRDRERAASEVQISGIVQKLAPQRLGASGDAANGAPIVGADGLVESGNARTIALQRVYQANGAKAQSYRDWLVANADTFGFTSDQVAAIEKPVLVRVRRTPVNRAEFARQANAPTTAVMSTVEQARSDAARIQSLDDLETDESGDFTGAGNRGFVRRFVGALAATEQAGLVGADGQLSQSGYARIRNAVLARAYGDSPVLQRMVESLDNNLRNITGALMRVAPQVAKARDSIAAGAMFDRDITENLLAAVEELSRLRSEGRSVAEYLAQAGMFGDGLAPETADLLGFLDQNIRSPKRISEFLQAYLDVLASAGNPNQDSLFGGAEAPAKQDIINLAKERAKREQDRGAVPDGARGATGADARGAANDDAGGAAGGAGGDRTGTEGRARLSRKAGGPPGSRPDEVTPAAPSSEGVVVSGDTITIDGVEYDATIEGFGQVTPPRTLADDDPLLTDTSTIDTAERRAMRDRIVDSFFAGATPVEGRKPILYLMGGGGGSGKGTIKKRLHAAGIIPESGPVDLDADEIKVHHIPEYAQIVAAGDSRAAATVHEESSALGKRVQRRAMEGGYDLIVDGTMSDAGKAHALMDMARKAGYEVALFGVTVDPRAAIVRAGKRAKRSGRYVPPAALLKAHKGFASIFGELLAAADWGAVFDNTGTEPRPIALKEAASQNPSVVNDSAYNEVIGYGGLNERANRFADVIPPEARRNDGRQGRVEEGQGRGRGRGGRAGHGEPGAGRQGRDGGVPSERVDPTEALRAALAALPQQTDRPTTPVQPTQAPPSAGLSVSGLRAGISKILAEAKRLPAGGVQVVQSVEDLPEGLRDFLRSENAESEVEGIYDPATRTVWLVADHLPTAERAEQVLFHELYGHFGLQGLFGKQLSATLRDLVARNRNLRVAAAKMRMEHGYDEDIANEEALVELAERGESLEGLRRFVAAMQKLLRGLGFERLANWMEGLTDAEAMTVIAEARRFVRGQAAGKTHLADPDQTGAARVMSRNASPGQSGTARPGTSNIGNGQASNSIDQQADAILAKKRGRFTPLETLTRLAVKATLLDRVTSGAYDRLLGLINRLTPETVKAGVVSDYGVLEAVIDRRIQMQGAVKAHYRQVGEIIAALGNLTRAESRVAYQWMNSDDPQSSDHFLQQLPAESVAVLADVEKWIDKLSADAVKLGLLTQEVRDRHRFAYLRRSYLKHEEEATAQEKTRRRRAISVLGDQYKGRGIVDGAPMRKIENVAPGWWKRKLQGTSADKALRGEKFLRLEKRSGTAQATNPLPGMPAGAAKRRLLDVVYWPVGEPVPAAYAAWEQAGTWQVRDVKGGDAVMWRDFTAQEREQMGEIDEVKYAVARTLHGMIHDVEAAQYLKWVSDKHSRATAAGIPKEKIVDATESLRTAYSPDQWVQVPDTTIKGTGGVTRYGALAGRYLPAPIWNDIRQSIGPQQMVLGEWYQNILRAWKVSKTALSPTVHVNNVMANFVMADWHDVRAPHIAKALEILVRSKDPAHRRIIDRFEDAGGTIGTWSLSELQREQLEPLLAQLKAQVSGGNGLVGAGAAIQLALSGKWREAASAAAGSKGAVATAAVAKAMIDLYQAEDVVFRLAAFIKAKEEGADDQAAAKVARKSFLDYQINAPWVQLMRQTAFPFVAFTYRAVPMLLETMAKKPWKLLKIAAVLGGLNALGYAMSGGDEDKERKLLPEEKAGKAYGFVAPKLIRMPWNDDNGSPVFLDIRRWIPVGDVLDAGQTHSAIPILPVAVPAGPLAVFAEIAFNQSQFTGREITKATDTGVVASIANLDVERMGLEQESKVFDHLFKAFAPNIALIPGTYAFTGIRNAATGRTDSFGREQSVAQAVASSVGVKLGSYPTDVLLLNETRKRDGALREIQENITGLKREYIRQGIGTEEYRKKLAEQQAKMQKVNRDFAERVQ